MKTKYIIWGITILLLIGLGWYLSRLTGCSGKGNKTETTVQDNAKTVKTVVANIQADKKTDTHKEDSLQSALDAALKLYDQQKKETVKSRAADKAEIADLRNKLVNAPQTFTPDDVDRFSDIKNNADTDCDRRTRNLENALRLAKQQTDLKANQKSKLEKAIDTLSNLPAVKIHNKAFFGGDIGFSQNTFEYFGISGAFQFKKSDNIYIAAVDVMRGKLVGRIGGYIPIRLRRK